MHARSITEHANRRIFVDKLDGQSLRCRPAQELPDFQHHRPKRNRAPAAHASPGKRQDLFHERLAAVPRVENRAQPFRHPLLFARIVQRELAVPEDRSEDVVEVVRDAARHRAERFDLLRLTQLRIQPLALELRTFALSYIYQHADDASGTGFARFDDPAGILYFDISAVGTLYAILQRVRSLVPGLHSAHLPQDRLAVNRM